MRQWVSTGKTTRTEAERFAVNLIRDKKDQEKKKKQEKSELTFKQYADPFFKYDECPHIRRLLDERKNYTRRTAKQNRGWLKTYVLEDEIVAMLLSEITRDDLLNFRSRLCKQLGEKINTVNKVMSVVKTIIKEAVYREILEMDPTSMIGNIKEDRRPPDTFTLEELQLLFPVETVGPWETIEDHTCFLVAASTGMRRGEVLALRWEQIHIDAGYDSAGERERSCFDSSFAWLVPGKNAAAL